MTNWNYNQLPDAFLYERLNDNDFKKDWYATTYFSSLTGDSRRSVIQIKNLKDHGGKIVNFPKRQRGRFTVVTAKNQVSGSEATLTYDTDTLVAVRNSIAAGDPDVMDTKLSYLHDYVAELKDEILVGRGRISRMRFLYEAIYGLLPKERNGETAPLISNDETNAEIARLNPLIGQIRLVDVHSADPAHKNQFSRARIMFGEDNKEALAADTVDEAWKAMNDNDGFTVNGIRAISRLARMGGRPDGKIRESAVEPFKFEMVKYGLQSNDYILLTSFEAYSQIATRDAVFISQFNRGIIERPNQPTILRGSDYKGGIEGVELVVDNELSNFNYTDDDGNIFTLNILLGAGAFGYLKGKTELVPKIDTDYNTVYGIAHHETMDLKALQYKSNKEANSELILPAGIIYWYTKIPAPKKTMRSLNALNTIKDEVTKLTDKK